MATWTAASMPRLDGRTIVITGGNSGIGASAASALAAAGANLVLACRNLDKARAVAQHMPGHAQVAALDLADLTSVRRFADSVASIDVLINNAGVMAVPYSLTADGFELQIGTNHLGHFALTLLLADRITDRVVTVSSGAHRAGRIDVADLNWEHRRYRRWPAYAQSKLANLQFSLELDRRLRAAGASLRAISAHPGYAATDLQAHTGTWQDRWMQLGNRFIAQSADQGVLPILFAAADPRAVGGGFYGPGGMLGLRGYPAPSSPSAAARNTDVAAQLWQLSTELTGVSLG